ncbi:MAG: hypothetical protein CM15mP117_17380 [Alphaproteobacteria bacterium]|nr:MAG: hypothetical protein CM15mP117_17380 [Alphaproteobacteria bacterium]
MMDGIDVRKLLPPTSEKYRFLSPRYVVDVNFYRAKHLLGSVRGRSRNGFVGGELAGVSEFANRHPDGYKLELKERGDHCREVSAPSFSLARAVKNLLC